MPLTRQADRQGSTALSQPTDAAEISISGSQATEISDIVSEPKVYCVPFNPKISIQKLSKNRNRLGSPELELSRGRRAGFGLGRVTPALF